MNRFLTPDEVRALSEPAVQKEIQLINAAMCRGDRSFISAHTAFFDAVAVGLRSAGWDVTVAREILDTTWFNVSPRNVTAADAERHGAELLSRAAGSST
jgi:predicted small integral membrane protein